MKYILTIRADGETGDIVWNGYLPDVIDELATANIAVIRIVADSIKKDDVEVIQTLSKYLLREFKNGIKREVEEIKE